MADDEAARAAFVARAAAAGLRDVEREVVAYRARDHGAGAVHQHAVLLVVARHAVGDEAALGHENPGAAIAAHGVSRRSAPDVERDPRAGVVVDGAAAHAPPLAA